MLMKQVEDLPEGPGSYALHMLLREPLRLSIGRSGTFSFPAGHYFYLGSAHGPGGLRARLHHHIRIAGHPQWHLDFLRPQVELVEVWCATADQTKPAGFL